MKRLLNTLTKRGYEASFVEGNEYDYIRIETTDDYIEISSVDDEVILVTENSSVNADSLRIADIESAIKVIQ